MAAADPNQALMLVQQAPHPQSHLHSPDAFDLMFLIIFAH